MYICAYTNVYIYYSNVGRKDCNVSVKVLIDLFYSELWAQTYL